MHCLIYARVSTSAQADKELSIPAQLQAMRQYALTRNWTILEEFVDAGVSGRTTARPMLHRLLARCRNPHDQIEVVLVHKIDRLARNVADHAMIRVMLKQRGIRLASVVENLDDSVSGQLVEHMMAAVAEFHSSNLAEETKKGMRQKVLQGGWPHLPPRGYRVEREGAISRVVIDPVEGPLVAEAFELYASGWFSVKRLCRQLANEGLRSRTDGPMAPSHLTRLLSNPFYLGRLRWKDLQVPGQHLPLVSVDVFERVQAVRRQRHRQIGILEGLPGYPLRGVGVCASCGGRMTVDRRPRWNYYRCSRQAYRREVCSARFCPTDRAHGDLERICRSLLVNEGKSVWEIYASLSDVDRVRLIANVFERIIISSEGVRDFTLKPLWIRATLAPQKLLNAA
jgi:site-specific DNA recombinase